MKSLALLGTRGFTAVFIRVYHRSIPETRRTQFRPSLPLLHSVLAPSSYLHRGFPKCFPSRFPIKTVCTFLSSPYVLHIQPILHLVILIIFCEECILWSSSLHSFTQSLELKPHKLYRNNEFISCFTRKSTLGVCNYTCITEIL
jgi:hypothetical protein